MQARLQDINALVKIKNPSLLLQLQRAPPRFPSVPAIGGKLHTHAALEPAAAAGDSLSPRMRLCSPDCCSVRLAGVAGTALAGPGR